MRVAVVAYSSPPFSAGGVASAHFNLYRALQGAGIEARLFTFGDHGRESTKEIQRSGTHPKFAKMLMTVWRSIMNILDPGKNAHEIADILRSSVGALKMGGKIAKFKPDAIVLSDHGAPGFFLNKPKGAKVILVSHHNPARFAEDSDLTNAGKTDAQLALWCEQRVLRKVDVVVCPSGYMKKWFEKTYRFTGPVHVIPNLVDETFIHNIHPADIRSQYNLPKEVPVIYMPSAGSKLKGSQYSARIIIHIAAGAKENIAFYIPGVAQAEFIGQVTGIPNNVHIAIPGQVPYEQNLANLKSCAFGISPSLMENYSMALLEAAHCEVPMLAFDTGGNADIIVDGENGRLFGEGDIEGLVAEALSLLEPDALENMRHKTKHAAQERLSSQSTMAKYLELLRAL